MDFADFSQFLILLELQVTQNYVVQPYSINNFRHSNDPHEFALFSHIRRLCQAKMFYNYNYLTNYTNKYFYFLISIFTFSVSNFFVNGSYYKVYLCNDNQFTFFESSFQNSFQIYILISVNLIVFELTVFTFLIDFL